MTAFLFDWNWKSRNGVNLLEIIGFFFVIQMEIILILAPNGISKIEKMLIFSVKCGKMEISTKTEEKTTTIDVPHLIRIPLFLLISYTAQSHIWKEKEKCGK